MGRERRSVAVEEGGEGGGSYQRGTRATKSVSRMNSGARVAVDGAELINWWDALDDLSSGDAAVERCLHVARNFSHPDAQWLASLLPAGVAVSRQRLCEVMLEQRDDPRAMLIAWRLSASGSSRDLLVRSAQMGYAPAQAMLALLSTRGDESFVWAQKAAAQRERRGLYELGECHMRGAGCARDERKATEFYKEAAELGYAPAQCRYGRLAFGEMGWERFHWCSLAASRGVGITLFVREVLDNCVLLALGLYDRILHTVAPVFAKHFRVEERTVFGTRLDQSQMQDIQRILVVHEKMLGRARRAIDCWSMAGRRCRVVKDMRVMIAKMLWGEAWRWGVRVEETERAEKRRK
jgi:TPR repeat protein